MEKIINAIVDGGKATAGPPLGPALGPLGVNAGQVIAKINEATKDFAGMKVPVKVIVDTETKEFRVEVGTPPTAELIKKEAKIEKGAGNREAPAGERCRCACGVATFLGIVRGPTAGVSPGGPSARHTGTGLHRGRHTARLGTICRT